MIYEDEKNYEKPSHVTYKEYKKKLETNPNEGLILFVSAFFVLLLIFLGVAKQLSPDVDVSIGDNSDIAAEEYTRGSVDGRLRLIQMEDNAQDDTFSPELEEKVVLPARKQIAAEQEDVIVLEHNNTAAQKLPEQTISVQSPNQSAQSAQPITEAPQPQAVAAKVIVGYYATAEQAEVAKGIVQEAGLNLQPFIKNIGGAYTLQVGSFSSREKAQSAANELLKNNFPAKVIVE